MSAAPRTRTGAGTAVASKPRASGRARASSHTADTLAKRSTGKAAAAGNVAGKVAATQPATKGSTAKKTASKTSVNTTSPAKPAAKTSLKQPAVKAAVNAAYAMPEQLSLTGSISFVGMGPGDPTLLTLRAADLLAKAEVVIIDDTLGDTDLRLVRSRCRADVDLRVTSAAEHDPDQARQLSTSRVKTLVELVKSGRAVVRLLHGDPAMASTLAEDAAGCTKARVPFEVVPGVSAASAWAGYAGIPLASLGSAETRVLRVDADPRGIDWQHVGSGSANLVMVGAVPILDTIAKQLMAAGRPDTTPVAVIAEGTTSQQRTVVTTLGVLARSLAEIPLPLRTSSPITVVGEVVNMRSSLSWFESKPLFAWRVLVPRTKENPSPMVPTLRAFGAVPEEVPTIAVEPPRTPQQIERAITGVVTGRYNWVAFTSPNAVRAIRAKLEEYGLDARALSGMKVAAMDPGSLSVLAQWGIKADLAPDFSADPDAAGGSTAALAAVWPLYDPGSDPINRVFIPRADISTDALTDALTQRGWEVDDVIAYRTVRAAPPPAPVREAIKGGLFDAVLFTSSSALRNLVGIAGKPHSSTIIGCIGPATAATAAEHGLRVDVMAPQPSQESLAAALAEFAVRRQVEAIEAGQVVTPGSLRPSQRRAGSRRKAAAAAAALSAW